jgi:putative ABC transport system permease protein
VSVLGGLYPALVLARQRSVAPSRGARERRASNVLVAAQFTASSFLLLAAMVTYLQNAAMQRSLRAAPHPLVIIENFYTATRLHPDTLRRELAALAHSSGVTDMARPPWTGVNVLPLGTSPADAAVQRSAIWHTVGRDFFATFGIRLLAGRVFDGAHGDDALTFLGDSRRPNNIVIDRTLAQELGFPSAEAAVGGIVYVPRELMAGFGGSGAQPLRVIGVVADRPLTLAGGGARGSVYSFADPLPFQVVRIARTHVAEALAEIDALWKRLAPSVALRRRFEDEIFAEKYAGHEQVNRALAALALFAFAISAIGLFSMAKVAARRRLREIAVRKVLGATTTAVTMLMLASFARPIIVANVVAWPAGYFAARAYLAGFVAPVPLTVFPFVLCLAMTVLVVGATVFSQTLRVARIKPCAALRHE